MMEMPIHCEAYRNLTQEQTHQEISRANYMDTQVTVVACKIEKRKFAESKNKRRSDS